MNTVLHLPLTKTLRTQAEINAKKSGYSSIQELLRVFLVQFTSGAIKPGFVVNTHDHLLTPEQVNRLDKKASKLENAVINGDAYSVTTVREMMDILEK